MKKLIALLCAAALTSITLWGCTPHTHFPPDSDSSDTENSGNGNNGSDNSGNGNGDNSGNDNGGSDNSGNDNGGSDNGGNGNNGSGNGNDNGGNDNGDNSDNGGNGNDNSGNGGNGDNSDNGDNSGNGNGDNDAGTDTVEYKYYIRSTTDNLTVRRGAGTSTNAVGSLDKGDMVTYTGKSGGWYKTVYKESVAYVYAQYAEIVTVQAAEEPVERVIEYGNELLGLPYVYGAARYHFNGIKNSAFTGASYDCSSFVQYVFYKGADVILGSTSREQSLQGKSVNTFSRGDALFFTNASRAHLTGIERIGHVGIYLGNNYILHTASDHAVIEPVSNARWEYFITAKRFI